LGEFVIIAAATHISWEVILAAALVGAGIWLAVRRGGS
jgi:hypothetical protein